MGTPFANLVSTVLGAGRLTSLGADQAFRGYDRGVALQHKMTDLLAGGGGELEANSKAGARCGRSNPLAPESF